MDFLFKLYFSAFRRYGVKGVEASLIILMAPLSFNIYLLVLWCLSFLIELKEVGAFLFLFGLAAVTISTLLYLRYEYLTKERYKDVRIKFPVVNTILDFLFFIFSIVLFSLCVYLMYGE